MIRSHQQVRAILPHRFPIIMVDQILALEDRKSIHATKNICRNEPCFHGLSQEELYFPRTLALESFLQAGGILCYDAWSANHNIAESALLFVGLTGFTWHREIPVGVTIHHHASIDVLFEAAAVYHGEVWLENELVAKIEQVTVAVRPMGEVSNGGRTP
jgi:3-hydroxyacyl-[acyl-carrier-protein] dehydratase